MKLIQDNFVPVAIDQWYQRRQQDAEGEFWRKIAGQSPRNDFRQTTQGHFICDASGKLLGYNPNHVDLERVRAFIRDAFDKFDSDAQKDVKPLVVKNRDPQFDVRQPENGIVVRMYSKVLGGYEKAKNSSAKAFQSSVGQDNLWITEDEKQDLIQAVRKDGEVPAEIAYRIARFCLIDNTRGEPPRWRFDQVKKISMRIDNGVLKGNVELKTEDEKRGYVCELFGYVSVKGKEVTRFDIAVEGQFWGQGRHTPWAPKGKFPLVFTFQLADPSSAESHAVPHGAKGWVDGYYNAAKP